MRSKIFSVFSILLFSSVIILGWGDKGHKSITLFAMRQLPADMKLSDEIKSAIIEHSVDPDNRKRDDKSEGPKHFIDIDYYKEYLDGKMITSLDSLKQIYPESTIIKEGILPWATEVAFYKLIDAFKTKDKDKVILYASDLAHYVGDGHQPLHATLNYNGQLTSQKGIHARYEIEMFDDNIKEVESKVELFRPAYIRDLRAYIFDYITEASNYVEMILGADKFCSTKTDGSFNKDYYRLLWFKTKYVTINEVNEASRSLASLIFTAWLDAGKPVLEN